MTQQLLPLITFYQGWEGYQRNLVNAIAPLTSEQLALPAASHRWTIRMLAQHLLGNRVWWFQLWMGEGNPELAPIMHWDPGEVLEPPAVDAAELVAAFESTWGMVSQALSRWTPADLEHEFSPPASLSEKEREFWGDLTLRWIIWHVLEHEIYHGGELSLALGGYGLPGMYGGI